MTTAADQRLPQHLVPESGGAQILASDLRIALLLINEGRYWALGRVFGCTRQQTNLVTLVGTLMVAQGLSDRWRRLMSGPKAPPLEDDLFAFSALRELVSGAAGPSVRDTPGLPNLLLFAVLAGSATPTVLRSLRAVKRASHRVDTGFRHRYGYLVDVGHRRARHYEMQERAGLVTQAADDERR